MEKTCLTRRIAPSTEFRVLRTESPEYRQTVSSWQLAVMIPELKVGKLYDEAIQYAKSFPDAWFARRIDIARWILENRQ